MDEEAVQRAILKDARKLLEMAAKECNRMSRDSDVDWESSAYDQKEIALLYSAMTITGLLDPVEYVPVTFPLKES